MEYRPKCEFIMFQLVAARRFIFELSSPPQFEIQTYSSFKSHPNIFEFKLKLRHIGIYNYNKSSI